MLRTILKASVGFAFGFGVGMASAQALRNSDQPAEFPPASYTGKQYVDSKGCVFVRAGFDGAVTWVPRVNRKRNVLCGFEPTFARNEKPAPAPRLAEAPTITAPPRPVATAAPAPTPPRQTVAAAPPRVTTPAPRATAPALRVASPAQVRAATPTRVTAAPAQPVRGGPTQLTRIPAPSTGVATACPGVSPLGQKYMNTGTHTIRCGPQGINPTTVTTRGIAPITAAPTGVLRVAPAPEITPPPGYRAAFDDDRFNPNRGLGTREGHAQMRLVWTSGLPRRLVDQNTGRDVTSLFPRLRFPFISETQQNRYVAANGAPSGAGYVVSSKNTPATAPTQVPAGHRFVQVGTFGVPANAQNSVARLKALGLPVRVGTYKKNGKTLRIVLAGPFGNASQLRAGLNAVRRAGFGDAFSRR